MTCFQIRMFVNITFECTAWQYYKNKASNTFLILLTTKKYGVMHLSRAFEGYFSSVLMHIFLKLRKWSADFSPSFPNYAHGKSWKNLVLSLETNMIQRIIKYCYANMVINQNVILFYY